MCIYLIFLYIGNEYEGKDYWIAHRKFFFVNKSNWLDFLTFCLPLVHQKNLNINLETGHRNGFWYIQAKNDEISFFKKVLSIK